MTRTASDLLGWKRFQASSAIDRGVRKIVVGPARIVLAVQCLFSDKSCVCSLGECSTLA